MGERAIQAAAVMNNNGWKTWVIGALTILTSGLTAIYVNDVRGDQARVDEKVDEQYIRQAHVNTDNATLLAVLRADIGAIKEDIREIKEMIKRLPTK